MAVPYYGDFPEDDTVNLPVNTFDSNDPAGSVTATDWANSDIFVHKDGSATAITTDGATVDIDAPGVGAHMVTIDTSVDAAYATGSEYAVRVDGVTVDGGTINAWIGAFSIERAGGALAVALTIKTETALIVADTNETQGKLPTNKFMGSSDGADDDGNIAAILVDTGTTIPGTITTLQADTDDIQTRLPAALVGGLMSSDVTAISTDTTAADNLELQYDTTGLTGDTFPSTQSQVNATSASAGGSVNIAATADNTGGAIKGVSFVGSVQGGTTFTNTEAADGVYHDIDDTTDVIDIIYSYAIGGGRTATEVEFTGFVQGNSDLMLIKAYDFVGADWETIATLTGANGTNNIIVTAPLLVKHTGLGSDLGSVLIRLDTDSTTPSNLSVDQLLVSAVSIGQTVGYANGSIWIDTVNGTAGTENFVNGTADNTVDSIADAFTISGSLTIEDFHLINGSSVTLAADSSNKSFFGDNWTLALGGQVGSGIYVQGASISGTATAASEIHFEGCDVATASLQRVHADFCSFAGTVTHTLAADYNYHNCYSKGSTPPVFTKTAGQAIVLEFHNYSGDITLSGLQSGDTVGLGGQFRNIILNGADATVDIHGQYETITNNLTGSPTVSIDGAVKAGDVADTLADTADIQTRLPAVLVNSRMDSTIDATGFEDAAVDKVWDEVLTGATHNVVDSSGRRLRDLQEFGIYEGGAVWIDTVNGTAGTTDFESGTNFNPVDSIADATTVAASVGLTRFKLAPGSTITLAQTYNSFSFDGVGATINMGSQDVGGCRFIGTNLTGTGTGAGGRIVIRESIITGATSISTATFLDCNLSTSTLTLSSAGKYIFDGCFNGDKEGSSQIIDYGGSVLNTDTVFRHWSGCLDIRNMGQAGTDTLIIEGVGDLIFNVNCTGGTASVFGGIVITNNGSVTLTTTGEELTQISAVKTDTAAILVDTGTTLDGKIDTIDTNVDSILVDTVDIQGRLPAALVSGLMSSDMTALSTSTTAADNLEKSALQIIPGAAEGTPSTTVIQTDLAESSDDIYIGRVVIFTSGAAKDEATDITDYTGATGTLTVTALSNAPSAADTFIII